MLSDKPILYPKKSKFADKEAFCLTHFPGYYPSFGLKRKRDPDYEMGRVRD